MRFRYLRIAFSATCLIACVLLIVLWVRSHWWEDAVNFPTTGTTWVNSFDGEIGVVYWPPDASRPEPQQWRLTSISARVIRPQVEAQLGKHRSSWYCYLNRAGSTVGFPHWFPVLTCITFAALPWLPLR